MPSTAKSNTFASSARAASSPGAGAAPVEAVALADLLAQAYAGATGRELAPFDEPLAEAEAPPALEAEANLARSGVAEIPAGFVEALLRHEGGQVLEARLRGDFMAPADLLAGLERALAGCPLEAQALGRRVDQAFSSPGAFIHGLSALGILPEALLAAAVP